MEGTNLGSEDRGPGELNVEASITSQIESAEGIVLVAFSPQNLDRLVTLFKAARRNRRELVVDLYTAEILEALGHHRLPKVGWDGIRVIVPASQRTKAKRESSFRLLNSLGKGRISIDEVSSDPAGFVVMFRKSMCDEFEELAYRDGTELIWSMWGGYLDRDDELRKWLSDRNVSVTKTHASGHATTDDLVRFAGAVSAREVVPIHTTSSHRYQELFENVRVRADGEWWSV
jgi:ribonuclease J